MGNKHRYSEILLIYCTGLNAMNWTEVLPLWRQGLSSEVEFSVHLLYFHFLFSRWNSMAADIPGETGGKTLGCDLTSGWWWDMWLLGGGTRALNRLWEQHSHVSALEMAEYRSQSATPSANASEERKRKKKHMGMRKPVQLSWLETKDGCRERQRWWCCGAAVCCRSVFSFIYKSRPSWGCYWFICMSPGKKAIDQYLFSICGADRRALRSAVSTVIYSRHTV